MSAKNNNYYPLNAFNSFSKDKFYQDFNMNNYMINKKGMFTPKKFNILTFAFLSIVSVLLNIFIGGLSFVITLYFSNNEDFSNSIANLIMKGFSVLSIMCILYFSFVLSISTNHYDFLTFLVKKNNTSYFGQEEYDLVKKHCPSELDKWVSAIIDYGEKNSNEAKKYADNIVKISQKRKDRAEKEKNSSVDEKWVDHRVSSDVLLDFE